MGLCVTERKKFLKEGLNRSTRVHRLVAGAAEIELGCREMGVSFERESNGGHTWMVPATLELQRRGKPIAASFQRLQARWKLNVERRASGIRVAYLCVGPDGMKKHI